MASHQSTTQASIDDLTPLLFDHLMARIIDLDPKSATKLQLVSSRFFDSASKALYEELSFPDDVRSLTRPTSRSRLEAVIRYPNKYSKFVRAITITPKPKVLLGDEDDQDGRLESLEAFIWSSDRIMPSELLTSLSTVTPALSILSIRPKLSNDNQTQSPLFSQTSSFSPNNNINNTNPPICSIPMGSIGTPSTSPRGVQTIQSTQSQGQDQEGTRSELITRSDSVGIHSFPCLRELYLSKLSMEGARNLTLALPFLSHLEHVLLDFTFVEDSLLCNMIESCKNLKTLRIRTSGTKTTDKSILSLLESNSLQSLDLSSVEGRLTKKLWSKTQFLSDNFTTLKVSFEEVGHHHSWVTDHLASVFDILSTSLVGLKVFSIERIYPIEVKVSNQNNRNGHASRSGSGNGNGINSLGLGIGISQPINYNPSPETQIQVPSALGLYSVGSNQGMDGNASILPPCNEVVAPRPFPREGLIALRDHGKSLVTLNLDFWSISCDELKAILEACPNVEELKVLVNGSVSKIVSVASATPQRLPSLQVLIFSVTENNLESTSSCLAPTTSQVLLPGGGTIHKLTSGDATIAKHHRRTRSSSIPSSISSVPDLSPSTSIISQLDQDEAVTPANSPIRDRKLFSARRSRKQSVGEEPTSGLPGSTLEATGIESSASAMITKREIRKLLKRCPNLKILRWIGRGGKGEWHISSSGHQKIEFFPSESIIVGNGAIDDPYAFDASLARHKTSSTASLKERLPISVNALVEGGVENPAPFLQGGALNPTVKPTLRGKGKDVGRSKTKEKSSSQNNKLEGEEEIRIERETPTKHGRHMSRSSSSITSASVSVQSSPQVGKKETQSFPNVKSGSNQTPNLEASVNHQDGVFGSSSPVERANRNPGKGEKSKGKSFGRRDRDEGEKHQDRFSDDRFSNRKSGGSGDGNGGSASNLNSGGKTSNFKDRKGSFNTSNPQEVSSPFSASKPITIPGSGSHSQREAKTEVKQARYIPGAPPEFSRSASGSNKSNSPPVSLSRSISRSPDDERDLEESSESQAFGKRKPPVEARSWSLANAAGTSHINARGRKTKPLSKMTSKGGAAVGANSGGGKKH